MEIEVKYNCTFVDWEVVRDTLKEVGMGYFCNADKMKEKGFTE